AEHRAPPPAEDAEPRHDRGVLAELAVAGDRGEFLEQRRGIIAGVRAVGMARDLGLLPRRQFGVDFPERLLRLDLELGDLIADGHALALLAQRAQLLDLALQVRDRFFEIEVASHSAPITSENVRQTGCADSACQERPNGAPATSPGRS